jgi:hypothetical protein
MRGPAGRANKFRVGVPRRGKDRLDNSVSISDRLEIPEL